MTCLYLINLDILLEIMNISFTKQEENYILEQVASGEYQNNSEVIRDALRLHSIYRTKVIEDLRKEIEKGWSEITSNRSVTDIIEAKKALNDLK